MSPTTIREQLLTSLALLTVTKPCTRRDLIRVAMSHPDCEWREMVECVLDMLIQEGRILELPAIYDDDSLLRLRDETPLSMDPDAPLSVHIRVRLRSLRRRVMSWLMPWTWGKGK